MDIVSAIVEGQVLGYGAGTGGGGESTELTTTQIAALSTTQANALSATQAAGLAVATVTGITSEQVASTKVGFAKSGSPTSAGLQFIMQHMFSTGMLDGGALTDNGDGTFNIAAADFMVRQGTAEDDPLVVYRIAAATNLNTTANDVNWIYLDYNSGSPRYVVTTSLSAFNGIDKVVVYGIGRTGNHNHILDLRAVNVDSQRKQRRRDAEWDGFAFQGYWRSSLAASPLSSSGLNLLVGAGSYWYFNKNLTHAAFNTTVAGTADVNVFTLWYNRTGTWTSVADQKSINTTQYDLAGTLTTMTNNRWRCDWVYVIPDSSHQHLIVVLGNAEYNSQASAQASAMPSSLPPQFAELAILVGQVVIQKSAASVTVAQAGSVTFSGAAVSDHGALSGLTDLDHPQYQTTTDAATLTSTQIASIGSAQMAALSTTALQGLTTTQVAAIPTSALAGLTSAQLASFTATAMGGMTESQFAGLSTGAIKGLFGHAIPLISEKVSIDATTSLGSAAINHPYLASGQLLMFMGTPGSAGANTWNLQGDGSSIGFSSGLAVGEARTLAVGVNNGTSAQVRYLNSVSIAGLTVTPLWQGGSAPTSGNSGALDMYSCVVMRNSSSTALALLSQTKFDS